MDINLIFTIVGFIITTVGLYWDMKNRINLLEEKLSNHKDVTNDNFARLIKSMEKLDSSIEKLNDRIDGLK